jgi:hypothetical protein
MTISTLGVGAGVINAYDSLYESISSYVENQVAAIVFTETEDITLNFIDVQKQTGTCDCGHSPHNWMLARETTLRPRKNACHWAFIQVLGKWSNGEFPSSEAETAQE